MQYQVNLNVKKIKSDNMKRVGLQISRLSLCRRFILLCFGFSIAGLLQAETHILNSTKMVVTPGTTITNMDNLLLDNGGVLNNQGTMVIKGNLVNNNSSSSNLGTGTFIFSGTSAQTISGHNIFKHLAINNSTGVAILDTTDVTDTLELTQGLLKLRYSNLTLGATGKVTGNPPSNTNMVSADSTGQFRKLYGNTGTFLFPVGDSLAGGTYSPVRLNFTGGTFGAGAYAGVTLRKRKYNDPNLVTDYLKRYWTVTTNNITGGVSCNAYYHYVQADVQGTETAIYSLRMNPLTTFSQTSATGDSLTANGLNVFGDFTGGHPAVSSNLKVYLQGPWNGTTMNTTLTTLPLGLRTDPTKFPDHQPYNIAPWLYAGLENVVSLPSGVVDWIFIELRQASSNVNAHASTAFAWRAAFVKTDGTVVDMDGVSPVKFYNAAVTTSLFPVIYHRNHLAIMANNAVTLTNGVYTYDYTANGAIYNTGTNGLIQLATGKWGMVSGDADQDKSVQITDFVVWTNQAGQPNGYYSSDFNFSTDVQITDFTLWAANSGSGSSIPNP